MTQQNINWCIDNVIKWLDEDPSLSWSEIWEALADCLDGEKIDLLDRMQIKRLVNNVRN